MPTGTLQIFTSLADEALALSNVIVRVFKEEDGIIIFEQYYITDIEEQVRSFPLKPKTKICRLRKVIHSVLMKFTALS